MLHTKKTHGKWAWRTYAFLVALLGLMVSFCSYAAEDVTNTFTGTINGEQVTGYLDKTYVYYNSGKDYNASFVTFGEDGSPRYNIYVRIDKDTPAGTFASSEKVYLEVDNGLNASSLKWTDSYTTANSTNTEWTLTFNQVEYSDDGVFKGSVEGELEPGRYNRSPAYSKIEISGQFQFQMRTIHPTMETYRASHSDYAAAHDVSYVQSIGGGGSSGSSSNDGSSSGSSSSSDHACRTCRGTGLCTKCHGLTTVTNSYSGRVEDCPRCLGSGRCSVCAGTGKVY